MQAPKLCGRVAQPLALSGTGKDFSFSAGATSAATVSPGQSAIYTLTLAPQGGFDGTVEVTCTGAPSAATCTPSPASLRLIGSSSATVTVTVATTAASFAPRVKLSPPPQGRLSGNKSVWPIALYLLALTLTVIFTSVARKRRIAIVLAMAGLCVALWASCGGGGGYGGGGGQQHIAGTPAGTYSLTITASGGNITQNVKVSLTVQ